MLAFQWIVGFFATKKNEWIHVETISTAENDEELIRSFITKHPKSIVKINAVWYSMVDHIHAQAQYFILSKNWEERKPPKNALWNLLQETQNHKTIKQWNTITAQSSEYE